MPPIRPSQETARNHHVNHPPPAPKPKPPEVPKDNPAVPVNNAGAAAKKGDVSGYGMQRRNELEDKYLYQSNVGDAVAGATGAARAYTSTAEKLGFAPRTPESATAARTVANTINEQITSNRLPQKYKDTNQTVGVAVHKDGSLTVSFSGDGSDVQDLQKQRLYERKATVETESPAKTETAPKPKLTPEEIEAAKNRTPEEKAAARSSKKELEAQASANKKARQEARAEAQKLAENAPKLETEIQRNLNEAFKDNPTVKRNGNGDVEWRFGKPDNNLNVRPASERNQSGGVQLMQRDANNCAAGKFYHADNNTSNNPVIAADEVWRPDAKSKHADPIKINNSDGRSMCPCSSCATNADKVAKGRFEPDGMTVRSGLRTGATGAGIAAATSTLEQLWNTGTVDAGKLASDTGLGAITSIAGEGIERAATPFLTNGAERAVNKVAAQILTTGETKLVGATLGKLGGAGAAGGIISAGFEAYNQRANFSDSEKRPEAIGAVVGQAAVGVAAGVAGAQIGAMIGTAIPIPGVGTVVGAAVGFGVGYALSATGADKAIANGVATAYRGAENAVKDVGSAISGAANKLASVFGW